MMMMLNEDGLKPRGLKDGDLIGDVQWCCPVQTFERQNNDFVLDSLQSLSHCSWWKSRD